MDRAGSHREKHLSRRRKRFQRRTCRQLPSMGGPEALLTTDGFQAASHGMTTCVVAIAAIPQHRMRKHHSCGVECQTCNASSCITRIGGHIMCRRHVRGGVVCQGAALHLRCNTLLANIKGNMRRSWQCSSREEQSIQPEWAERDAPALQKDDDERRFGYDVVETVGWGLLLAPSHPILSDHAGPRGLVPTNTPWRGVFLDCIRKSRVRCQYPSPPEQVWFLRSWSYLVGGSRGAKLVIGSLECRPAPAKYWSLYGDDRQIAGRRRWG
ncbi:hypothetical protein LY76DRAFT_415262 [Colletotrichum caudatum]|nr:hypothetical protein LY76DRAFT_415262 [Colletotrichum caudatum]